MSGDPQPAVDLVGDRCSRAVLASQRAQVEHPLVRSPEKRVRDGDTPAIGLPGLAHPHDVAKTVDVVRTTRPSPEGPQIEDAAVLAPEERSAASAHDLGPVVDPESHARGAPEGPEIPHSVRRRPEESMRLAGRRFRQAYHLAALVHVVRDARDPAQGPEVEHLARLGDEERVLCRFPAGPGMSCHLSQPVEPQRLALIPAERAEIEARALGQQVGVKGAEARVSAAHDFALLIDVVRRAADAGAGLQVGDPRGLAPQERPAAAQGVPARAYHLSEPVHRLRLAEGAAPSQRAQVADRHPRGHTAGRRPSCALAHIPACTAVSAVGPSNRCTRMLARPFRLTATRWRIETWPSAGLYFNRSWAPPASNPVRRSATRGSATERPGAAVTASWSKPPVLKRIPASAPAPSRWARNDSTCPPPVGVSCRRQAIRTRRCHEPRLTRPRSSR